MSWLALHFLWSRLRCDGAMYREDVGRRTIKIRIGGQYGHGSGSQMSVKSDPVKGWVGSVSSAVGV